MSTRGRPQWNRPGPTLRSGFGVTDDELAANPRFSNLTLGRFDRGMVLSKAEFQLFAPIIAEAVAVKDPGLLLLQLWLLWLHWFRLWLLWQGLSLIRHLYLSDGAQSEERPGRADRNAMLGEFIRALDSFLDSACDVALLEPLLPRANEPVGSMRYIAYGAFQNRLDQISRTRPLRVPDGMDPQVAELACQRYRALALAAGHLSGALFNCDFGSENEMLERLPWIQETVLTSLSDVVDYARRLRTAASEARAESIRDRGPEREPALDRAIEGLIVILGQHGIRVTHTPREKTRYTGGVHSSTARAIFQFMRLIDPKIRDTEVSTALASSIARRNKASGARCDGANHLIAN